MNHLTTEDAKLLRAVIVELRGIPDLDENQTRHLEAFESMLDRYRPLTLGQRDYLNGVAKRLEVDTEAPLLASQVPVGEAFRTPVPEVLKKPLPLRPPGRK